MNFVRERAGLCSEKAWRMRGKWCWGRRFNVYGIFDNKRVAREKAVGDSEKGGRLNRGEEIPRRIILLRLWDPGS